MSSTPGYRYDTLSRMAERDHDTLEEQTDKQR